MDIVNSHDGTDQTEEVAEDVMEDKNQELDAPIERKNVRVWTQLTDKFCE